MRATIFAEIASAVITGSECSDSSFRSSDHKILRLSSIHSTPQYKRSSMQSSANSTVARSKSKPHRGSRNSKRKSFTATGTLQHFSHRFVEPFKMKLTVECTESILRKVSCQDKTLQLLNSKLKLMTLFYKPLCFVMLSVAAVLSLVAAAQGHALAPKDEIKPTYGGEIIDMGDIPDVIKNPIDYGKDVLPDSWDWRKLGLLTTDLNQHIPQYWYV